MLESRAQLDGQIIDDRYKVEGLIGRGGMGNVWRVRHVHTLQYLALKTLHASPAYDRRAIKQLLVEARVTAAIRSPYVVQIFDVNPDYVHDGLSLPFFTMELVDGPSLASVLSDRGVLEPSELLWLMHHVCSGLRCAHALRIVHLDLKPSNILLTNSATGEQLVKLCDFGIAQHPPTPAGEYEGIASTTTDSGVLRGTPRFMAPEQLIRSGRTVPATDQWACALVAFRCLAGHDYFGTARNGVELVLDIVHESLVAPSELEPRLTKAFDAWFLKSCCRDPFERFSSVDAQFLGLREALGDVVMRPIARSRPAAGRNSPAHTDSVPVSLSRSADALNRDGHFWRDAAFGTMALVAFAISVLGTKLQSGALRSRAQASHLRSDGSAAQQAHLPPFAPSLRASSSPASAPALVPPFQTLPTPQDPSATAAPRSAGPAVPAKNEGRAGRPHSQSRLPRGAMCSRSTQCIDGLCLAETCQ